MKAIRFCSEQELIESLWKYLEEDHEDHGFHDADYCLSPATCGLQSDIEYGMAEQLFAEMMGLDELP